MWLEVDERGEETDVAARDRTTATRGTAATGEEFTQRHV